jgi:KaiC/GvpD/RAD55 family RecA-like ATPase
MRSNISVGISNLDKKLGGGIRKGSLVTLKTPAASNSDVLVSEFIDGNKTTYVTTRRSKKSVSMSFSETSQFDTDDVEIIEAIGDNIESQIVDTLKHSDADIFIIDRVNELENQDNYLEILRKLQEHAYDSDAICYLIQCEEGGKDGEKTRSVSDYVFELSVVLDGTKIVNRLLVTKSRYGSTINEILKLEITLNNGVSIDTSRDIA